MIKTLYPIFQKWSEKGSIYFVSDTHFEDADCKFMDPDWITPEKHIANLKKLVHKNDTLIHLGDVGNPAYMDELKCYKVLITGNHDVRGKMAGHFDEIYTGPLFIADRILLSHEPISGLGEMCLNIHGHVHNGTFYDGEGLNFASDVIGWNENNTIISLKDILEAGYLKDVKNYHRITIDEAIKKKGVINE